MGRWLQVNWAVLQRGGPEGAGQTADWASKSRMLSGLVTTWQKRLSAEDRFHLHPPLTPAPCPPRKMTGVLSYENVDGSAAGGSVKGRVPLVFTGCTGSF